MFQIMDPRLHFFANNKKNYPILFHVVFSTKTIWRPLTFFFAVLRRHPHFCRSLRHSLSRVAASNKLSTFHPQNTHLGPSSQIVALLLNKSHNVTNKLHLMFYYLENMPFSIPRPLTRSITFHLRKLRHLTFGGAVLGLYLGLEFIDVVTIKIMYCIG